MPEVGLLMVVILIKYIFKSWMATLFMLQDRALIRFLVQASQLRKINETLSNIDH